MFGAEVVTDWKEGSPILWKGVWNGKAYEDKGVILQAKPMELLVLTHFSPLTGKPDTPENYHTLTYALSGDGTTTTVSLSQDNNATKTEMDHAQKMWNSLLEGLRALLENHE